MLYYIQAFVKALLKYNTQSKRLPYCSCGSLFGALVIIWGLGKLGKACMIAEVLGYYNLAIISEIATITAEPLMAILLFSIISQRRVPPRLDA